MGKILDISEDQNGNVKLGWKSKTLFTVIIAAVIFAVMSFMSPAQAATTELIAAADIQELKGLIISCLSFITVIGTAYLTVLVGVSAFSMIRRVIRG